MVLDHIIGFRWAQIPRAELVPRPAASVNYTSYRYLRSSHLSASTTSNRPQRASITAQEPPSTSPTRADTFTMPIKPITGVRTSPVVARNLSQLSYCPLLKLGLLFYRAYRSTELIVLFRCSEGGLCSISVWLSVRSHSDLPPPPNSSAPANGALASGISRPP